MFDESPVPTRQRRRPRDYDDDELVLPEDPPDEDPLAYFRDEGWITEVLKEVKSGKEATVYCCAAGSELLAAKLYRSRTDRLFRNDAVYQAGRYVGGGRITRAFKNKSRKGREVQYAQWIDHEWTTLQRLHALGADVPRPIARTDTAILMTYYGDVDAPAPRLQDVAVPLDEARPMFERLMQNVELWLANETIHGDLSPYNVLYWQGQAIVIDFPQAVDPRFNPHARELLGRDVANLCRYFGRYGVRTDPVRISDYLWRRFLRADL